MSLDICGMNLFGIDPDVHANATISSTEKLIRKNFSENLRKITMTHELTIYIFF